MAHNRLGSAAGDWGGTAGSHMSLAECERNLDVDSHSLPDEALSGCLLDAADVEQEDSIDEQVRMQHTKDGVLDASPGKCSECQKPLMKNFFPCALCKVVVSVSYAAM